MLKDPVSLLIGLAIVAVFAVVIIILAKREGNSLKDILAKVPEDRKNQLKQSIFVPSDKKNLHFSDGLVADVVEHKGDTFRNDKHKYRYQHKKVYIYK